MNLHLSNETQVQPNASVFEFAGCVIGQLQKAERRLRAKLLKEHNVFTFAFAFCDGFIQSDLQTMMY